MSVKIGIFDPYLDTLGGGEKYMLTIAECLSDTHDVSVFWDDEHIKGEAEKRFSLDLSKVHFVDDIFSKKIDLLRRYLKTREYDLIIYLSDGSIPTVFSRHLFLHFQFPTEWVSHVPARTKLKLRLVEKILCNSQFTKAYIEKLFGKECVVLYPPVDLDYSFVQEHKENIILTVGRYTRPHGVEFKKQSFMVQAFKKIEDSNKNWKLVIITTSLPEDEKYIDELRNIAEGHAIQIHKNVSRADLMTYYKKAKIYWHAAGFGEDVEKYPDLAEHFGITTVEAMNRGAVPVVYGAGGQKEIVTNGRSGYLWSTEDDFLEKSAFLISSEKDRLKLAKNAFEESLQFDKKKFCKKLYSLL